MNLATNLPKIMHSVRLCKTLALVPGRKHSCRGSIMHIDSFEIFRQGRYIASSGFPFALALAFLIH